MDILEKAACFQNKRLLLWRNNMEIKINKEICGYNEALFFGLSTRQFLCSVLAVAAAAGIYFGLKGIIGRETASWLCMVAAAPIAAMGFFRYNGHIIDPLAERIKGNRHSNSRKPLYKQVIHLPQLQLASAAA